MVFDPDYSVDSISIIKEVIESCSITPEELSVKSKIELPLLKKILAREKEISYGESFLIATALEIAPHILVNIELNHRKKMIKKRIKPVDTGI